MSDHPTPAVVDALEELLDQERVALLKGDVDRINRAAARKEELVSKVDALTDIPSSVLTPLQDKLQRNQTLITHALDGIRAATQRIEDMRKARDSLQTYDQRGQLKDLSTTAKRAVEKRA